MVSVSRVPTRRPPRWRIGPLWLSVIVVLLGLLCRRWVMEVRAGQQQDFLVYVNAARALLDGTSLYQERAALPYTYPPFAAILFVPFAPMPDLLAALLWFAGNVALAIWITRRLLPAVPWWFTALVLLGAPLARSVYLGQINLLLFAALLLDVVWSRWRGTGMLLGAAAAIKVTPAWTALILLVRRDWAGAARAVATALALTCAAAVLRPADSRAYWTSYLWDQTRVGGLDYPDNQSVTGLLARLDDHGVPAQPARLVAIGVVLALTAVTLWHWRAEPLSVEAVTAVGLAGLLIAPVSWTHHWLWLVVFVAILVQHGRFAAATILAVVLAIEPLLLEGATHTLPRWSAALALSTFTVAGVVALVYLGRVPRARTVREDGS